MASPQRSLKHEYELYVEQEIENYKDSIPRSAILRIGDEAVAQMHNAEQAGFDELLLCTEVDKIIRKRLRLPSYSTWRRRRLKLLAEYRRPERWGMTADAPLVRAIPADSKAHVLVVGTHETGTALYLAANGCQVTSVEEDPDWVEKVMVAAGQVGLTSRLNGKVAPLGEWYPEAPVYAVVSTPAAFERLSSEERARAIEILKSATLDGGVHLVRTIVAGHAALNMEELRASYSGWDISIVEQDTFLARKTELSTASH